MAFCKSCGTEIGEAKFCPACGTSQDVTPVAPFQETVYQPISAEPISAPVFTPAPSAYSSSGDTAGTSTTQVPPVYSAPVYSSSSFEKPNTTGQTVFSIINIVLGVILCCCSFGLSFVSLVLGIIGVVFSSQAGKAATTEEAQKKLKTAKLLNIIAVAILVLSLILFCVLWAAGTYTSYLDSQGYSIG